MHLVGSPPSQNPPDTSLLTMTMSLRLPLLRPLRAAPLRAQPLLRRWYADQPDVPVKPKKRPPPPPMAPLEPTTFDGKATPRDVHNRPSLRGMPGTMSPWELERQHSRPRSNRAGPRPAPKPKLDEHLFNDSAAPRAIYQRPTRDLPIVNVSTGERLGEGVRRWEWWAMAAPSSGPDRKVRRFAVR